MSYVLISDEESGPVFCLGIYNSYYEALGVAMDNIFDFHRSYQGEGDEFDYTEPYELDGEGGVGIRMTYKAACWVKPEITNYYILDPLNEEKKPV